MDTEISRQLVRDSCRVLVGICVFQIGIDSYGQRLPDGLDRG